MLSELIVTAAAVGGLVVITTAPLDSMVMLPSVAVFCGSVTLVVISVSARARPDRRAATAAESINARLVKAYLSWFKTGSSRAETGWDPSSPQRRYLRCARREPFTLTGFCSAALGQLRAYGALGFSRRKTASTSRPAKKNRAPEVRRPIGCFYGKTISGGLGLALDHLHLAAIDGDAAGLLLFRDNPLQVHMEQSVLELRALDLDVLGQLEAALERTAGDAVVEVRRFVAAIVALAQYGQDALAHLDVQFLLA